MALVRGPIKLLQEPAGREAERTTFSRLVCLHASERVRKEMFPSSGHKNIAQVQNSFLGQEGTRVGQRGLQRKACADRSSEHIGRPIKRERCTSTPCILPGFFPTAHPGLKPTQSLTQLETSRTFQTKRIKPPLPIQLYLTQKSPVALPGRKTSQPEQVRAT